MTTFSSRFGRRALLGGLAAAATSPARAAGTRIDDAFGGIVLKDVPRRVVSLGYTTHDTLLALGVLPVAVRQWFGDAPGAIWPWAQPALQAVAAQGPAPVVLTGDVSVERVAALQPDLIIGIASGIPPEIHATLSKFAPVLMEARGQTSFGTPWDSVARRIGLALGRSAEAEAAIAATRKNFAEAQARHPGWAGRRAVAAYAFGGETGAFIRSDTRGRFLAELGFVEPEAVARRPVSYGFYARLSPEDLSPLDADLLLWVIATEQVPEVAALPLRRLLRAHREGREVVTTALVSAALSFGSILSLPFALEALEPELVAALDGNPATVVPSARETGIAP
ncbi:twin-arginine translocation pathway signal protein [Pseudoroseomonas deserti]|uniref:Twin-arginine translocation pathway signal protein n=2 Tax=Teichococcus deserti TaxID=1817963 RepID=A0A1V2H5A6_9PROT|nr:twin-arginine translocation pathway signal protein [Pseudoroseomonas deserti]